MVDKASQGPHAHDTQPRHAYVYQGGRETREEERDKTDDNKADDKTTER